jgi:hypothetical protein
LSERAIHQSWFPDFRTKKFTRQMKQIDFTKEVASYLLKSFLIEEGAYTKFCENINNPKKNPVTENFNNIDKLLNFLEENKVEFTFAIHTAFYKPLTEEGSTYWAYLQHKFEKLLQHYE